MGAECEYDLSNKEERDPGTANAPLTDDLSVRLCVSDTGFSRSVIYLGVKLFRAVSKDSLVVFQSFINRKPT